MNYSEFYMDMGGETTRGDDKCRENKKTNPALYVLAHLDLEISRTSELRIAGTDSARAIGNWMKAAE